MSRFKYQVRDASGKPAQGFLTAPGIAEAGAVLRREGKYIVRIEPVAEADSVEDHGLSVAQHAARVKRQDVVFFAHQLSVMLQTGVPISDALGCISDQAPNPHFRALVKSIADEVQSGGTLSGAMNKHPRVFPIVMVSLLRASEVSGTMGLMLERISKFLAKQQKIQRQARGALMYPCFMAAVAIGVTVFLMVVVLPRFATIYAQKGSSLPTPTRILLNMSRVMTDYWGFWLGGAALLVTAFAIFRRTPTGRRCLDWLQLHLPLVSKLSTALFVTRSCGTLGTMIKAGVPMLDAVKIVRDVTRNVYFERLWDRVDEALKQGMQLSDPLFRTTLMPRAVVQMIRSGEKSGRLGDVLTKVADFTEEEFDDTVKVTSQFIEPVMILGMGSMIGFVAIALLMPIFSVGKVMAG
jgi:type IV pilus assembly protein PilC